jgi:flagellum-specific peptidoglycan hydrolase FlgJ
MTPRKDETPEEFRARQRARYAAADPEYRERLLARQRERRRDRYATDPVYREQF